MKYGGGAPESLLSMGPELPRYATGHPKLASAAFLTNFGSYRELFIIMTFAEL